MSSDAWITLIVVVATLVLLATDRLSPALVMAGAVTTLLIAGVVDQDGALVGFSNDAPITVAALYVVAGAVKITGRCSDNANRSHGRCRRPRIDPRPHYAPAPPSHLLMQIDAKLFRLTDSATDVSALEVPDTAPRRRAKKYRRFLLESYGYGVSGRRP